MIGYWIDLAVRSKEMGKSRWKLYFKIGKLLTNLWYPITQRFNNRIGIDKDGTVIVSLTSFPQRINTVWVTIASLMNQSVKPKKIVLWLANEQFPNRKVPRTLQRLENRGLEIRYCDDLRPHKKYYYTMKEYPGETVITADDDVFYPEDHIEKLIEGSRKYPGSVVCRWSHEIRMDQCGAFLPYNDWPNECDIEPNFMLLPVGCNGVLYPPYSMSDEVFNKENLKKLALSTDDLWLKCMELLNGTKAVNCERTPIIFFNNIFLQHTGLWRSNAQVGINQNDLVWESLMREYPSAKKYLDMGKGKEK